MDMERIDSHHHFWQYSAEHYPWISESMSRLRQDFLAPNLAIETAANQISSVISVQARQSIEETNWLLEQSDGRDWIRGVVGWLPLAASNVCEEMETLREQKKLCGLRHVVQDEIEDEFLARGEFNRGISAMKDYGWTYDILIYGRQLPFAIPFVDRHPDQMFVLDHIAKPTIRDGLFDESWAIHLKELAKRSNVFCKFSGVVTEVRADGWQRQQIQPYWETALEAFGPSRLMFGSDWPVCLLKTSYADWVASVNSFTSQLSQAEQENFWSKNAIRAYRLK
jgi:L-fuconolactonase